MAGVLAAIGFIIHPATEDLMGILEPAWIPSHLLLWIGFTLALFGFVGIHARQSAKAGSLGGVGFVVLFIGTVALTGVFFAASTVEPLLAADAPAGLEAIGMSQSILWVLLGSIFLFSAGGILFGAAIVQARVLPKTGGLLILIACVLLVVTVVANMPEKVSDAVGVIFSAGLILLGRSLWSTKIP